MKYLIPATVTIEVKVPAKKGESAVSPVAVDIELIAEASDGKEALRKAAKHMETRFLKNIKLSLKNYSLSRNPIPIENPDQSDK